MVGAYTLYNLILPHMTQNIKLRYVNVEYLDDLLEKASKATESAGNSCRGFLYSALQDAVTQGYIDSNPVSGTRRYPRKTPNVTILSKVQLKVLLAAASKSKWYLETLLAVFCGLRKGEILGLEFSDFDRERNTVSIRRQITSNPIVPKGENKPSKYTVVEKPPKTENSYRMLRVPQVVIEELDVRKKRVETEIAKSGGEYYDGDYVSCADNGLPHSMTAFNGALTTLCERSALPHITVHGLRHQYASILVEQGVSLVKISALLGHSSVNTTYEHYISDVSDGERIVSFMNDRFVPESEV